MRPNNNFSRIIHLLAEYGYQLNEQNKTTSSETLAGRDEVAEKQNPQTRDVATFDFTLESH